MFYQSKYTQRCHILNRLVNFWQYHLILIYVYIIIIASLYQNLWSLLCPYIHRSTTWSSWSYLFPHKYYFIALLLSMIIKIILNLIGFWYLKWFKFYSYPDTRLLLVMMLRIQGNDFLIVIKNQVLGETWFNLGLKVQGSSSFLMESYLLFFNFCSFICDHFSFLKITSICNHPYTEPFLRGAKITQQIYN